MLDLGCGNTVHRAACEHAGFEYVGLDYDSAAAPILGDAHALPFRSESFEFVLSVAVLEHLRFPFVMMREVYRVLQPRGVFIGTVAFLEPFHGDSFYHHTHLGTYNSLREGGFRIQHICPSDTWSVLTAQANMGLFPRMPHLLSRSLVMPVQMMHRIWWRLGSLVSAKSSEKARITSTTGSFTFIAHKDAS
jgi:SAM-dependent methyltransferase